MNYTREQADRIAAALITAGSGGIFKGSAATLTPDGKVSYSAYGQR